MSLPVWGRAAILLLIFLVCLWSLLRKVILWVLSMIPFLLGKLFRYIYLLFEIPVAALHKKIGAGFHKIDNCLSQIGEKVDLFMAHWYTSWHYPKKYRFGITLLVYCLCVVFVAVPSLVHTDKAIWGIGEKLYISGEIFLVKLVNKQWWNNSVDQAAAKQQEQMEEAIAEIEPFETTLVVSGISSSLLVRDIPFLENCVVLERLGNGDKVIWRGEMQFSEAENNHVEPWVKIVTEEGIEGWSRLFYLHPEEYSEVKFWIGSMAEEVVD